MAQERGRQGQAGRHHRRDRDRQGDHGGRGGRRRHAGKDRRCRKAPPMCRSIRLSRCWRTKARTSRPPPHRGLSFRRSRRSPRRRQPPRRLRQRPSSQHRQPHLLPQRQLRRAETGGGQPCLRLAAGAPSRQGSRHRRIAYRRLRPARPRHRARRRRREIRQGIAPRRSGCCCGCRRHDSVHCAVDVGPADPRAVRRRQLRGRTA